MDGKHVDEDSDSDTDPLGLPSFTTFKRARKHEDFNDVVVPSTTIAVAPLCSKLEKKMMTCFQTGADRVAARGKHAASSGGSKMAHI